MGVKAVIMAGGQGTRLRPVNANRPKPMVRVLDRPMIGHIVGLLKRNGITDICVTVRHLARMIVDYLGDGSAYGVKVTYAYEDDALGTAGSVKNCGAFLDGGDILVISGDCICDFDLNSLTQFHRSRGAFATMALTAVRDPLEYGLVMTDPGGRVLGFSEKPAWDGVRTDRVNTGIYVLSGGALEEIPAGVPCDFGMDIFPRFLREGRLLCGMDMAGYWCDVGSPSAYRRCCMDALEGRVRLEDFGRDVCMSRLPKGVGLYPPYYIGAGCEIDSGSRIGPHAVIGEGSVISGGATVRDSITDGASVGRNARLDGAVVCERAVIGAGCELRPGAVVGEGGHIGAGSVLGGRAVLWPDSEIGCGEYINSRVGPAEAPAMLRFSGRGAASCGWATPEKAVSVGAACAQFGAVGLCRGDGADAAASAFASGAAAAGADVMDMGTGFEALAAWYGGQLGLPLTAYVSANGRDTTDILFFGPDGDRAQRSVERKVEACVGAGHRFPARAGRILPAAVSVHAYAYASGRGAGLSGDMVVAVSGRGLESAAMALAMSMAGFTVSDRRSGVPAFSPERGGLELSAVDEEGLRADPDRLCVLLSLIRLESGLKTLKVPESAPRATETLAGSFGAVVVRSESGCDISYRDGISAALEICAALSRHGERLADAVKRLPAFYTSRRVVAVQSGRAAVMRRMAELTGCCGPGAGIFRAAAGGGVTLRPDRAADAVTIIGESDSAEIAAELCDDFERLVKSSDQSGGAI